MRQADAVGAWWDQLDAVDRGRLLRLDESELLPEDLATGLAMHGVTVVPVGVSPVDGRPQGWWPPPVLEQLLADLRGDVPPAGPGGRRCQECGEPVQDGEEWVEVPLYAQLTCLVHVECAPEP
ncbi:hypothetical protein [Kineococcus sp. SYSU DK004]|uniref:hypothetical protein n=1 Tax=Kineococcus sp. SYSU DK004 TaxID=3383125 RepID=UPI003D7E3A41